MKVLGVELGGGVDTSAYDFRDELITELEKCIKEPFALTTPIAKADGILSTRLD